MTDVRLIAPLYPGGRVEGPVTGAMYTVSRQGRATVAEEDAGAFEVQGWYREEVAAPLPPEPNGGGTEPVGDGTLAVNVEVAHDAGGDDMAAPESLGAVKGQLSGTDLTKPATSMFGVRGYLAVMGEGAAQYPVGGVIGAVGAGVEHADGCVVGLVDGDFAAARPRAVFAARKCNSNADSNPEYGLDLQDDAAEGLGFAPLEPTKAAARLGGDVCVLTGAGVPTDETGSGHAGTGSLYVDTDGGVLSINVGTKDYPDWQYFVPSSVTGTRRRR